MSTKVKIEINNNELKKLVFEYIFHRFDRGQINPADIIIYVREKEKENWQEGEVSIEWEGEIGS